MITSTSVVVRSEDVELPSATVHSVTAANRQFERLAQALYSYVCQGKAAGYRIGDIRCAKRVVVGSVADSVSILSQFSSDCDRDAMRECLQRRLQVSHEWGFYEPYSCYELEQNPSDVASQILDGLLRGSPDDYLKRFYDTYVLLEALLPQVVGKRITQSPNSVTGNELCLSWMESLTELFVSLDEAFYSIEGWRSTKESRRLWPFAEKYVACRASYASYIADAKFTLLLARASVTATTLSALGRWRGQILHAVKSLLLAQVVMSLDVKPDNGLGEDQSLRIAKLLLRSCKEELLHA